ncbi:multidrug ABC transporter [Staphylococcus aureus]|nr:multidrug ABC transporter [Staphylococcus aureus]
MRLKSIITVIALILIMFMSAIESSIISLALPTIKQDLNAGNLISLIFTAYFIALVIANPIVGELLSRFKIIYVAIAGLLLFSIGSFMCGLSTNFTMLIISRVIQGFGSGVLMSLSQIVPKLAFEIPLRYKIMGIVGSVWGYFEYHWATSRWWYIRICNMALVILHKYTDCDHCHYISYMDISFSRGRNSC